MNTTIQVTSPAQEDGSVTVNPPLAVISQICGTDRSQTWLKTTEACVKAMTAHLQSWPGLNLEIGFELNDFTPRWSAKCALTKEHESDYAYIEHRCRMEFEFQKWILENLVNSQRLRSGIIASKLDAAIDRERERLAAVDTVKGRTAPVEPTRPQRFSKSKL